MVKFFFTLLYKSNLPITARKENLHFKILPPHEKGKGRRKDSRWIVMSTTPARALMDPIREECGLPWILSTLIFFGSICSLMA